MASTTVLGQQRFFVNARQNGTFPGNAKRNIVPEKYSATSIDPSSLKSFLWSLPSEEAVQGARAAAQIMELPMPDGTVARFKVWESSIQEEGLAAKFSDIKTFAGQGIDDKTATLRMDYSPDNGFHAQILSAQGSFYIDPYARGNNQNYISYRKADLTPRTGFTCEVTDNPIESQIASRIDAACRGNQLRTYRLAVACTGEYAQALGATNASQLHAFIVTSVNRITGVYERELAIRLVLVNNNNLIEYLNPAEDQFSQNNNPSGLLNEAQSVITSIIGSANYDIGHIFCSADSGVATLSSVCNNATKARGVTGHPNPQGDPFDIDYVAHEMGHQFGANHSFHTSLCASPGGSYEIGGGTTIMAYAGICSANENIQPNSDDIFHGISYDQIINFITTGNGSNCGTVTTLTNNLPVVTIVTPNNLSIPIGTPFVLEATATDADGDQVTYNWEGWDVTSTAANNWTTAGASTVRPLFRTRTSKTVGTRTFPDMRVILANFPGNSAPSVMDGLRGEVLPVIAREMKFRVTVRDNKAGGGGVVSAGGGGCQDNTPFIVNAVGTAPFRVLIPNGGESYPGGSQQTVTWDVAGTNAAPVNTANVRISYSTDGFVTSTVLAASTPNDGSEVVTIPVGITSTARIRIEAIGNIYFDISNQNFSVTAAVDGFEFGSVSPVNVVCNTTANTTVALSTSVFGTFTTPVNLTATTPTGVTVSFAPSTINPGNSTDITINGLAGLSNGTHTVTVTGTAGGVVRTREISLVVANGAGPSVSAQPAAQSVCIGSDATFAVTASGVTTYQWQVSTDGGNTFTNVASGGNAASYTVTGVTAGVNNNRYRVVLTGQCNVTTSASATLTAQQAPAISAAPETVTLCLNSNATFNTTASGTGIGYQWQVSTDGGTSYTNVGGATTSQLVVNSITTGMNGNRYRVVVSGTCSPAATSAAATLNVVSPVEVTVDPASIAECATGNVSFSVTGVGSNIIYAWERSTDNGANWQAVTNGGNYAGATTSTLAVSNLPAEFNNYRYRALLSNSICTTPDVSAEAVLTVNQRPTVDLTAQRLTLQPGQQSQITATINPSPAGFNITWFRNDNEVPGVNGTTYTADVTTLGNYKVTIVNPTTGCNNESAVLTLGAEASSRLFIYPSPTTGQFTVSFYNSNWNNQRQSIAIYDSKGGQVYASVLNLTGPFTLHPINLSGKASGIYYVVIGDGDGKKITESKVLLGY
ncbi:MAG: M12 family metallo-peptidase [Chitinophagaceae bacterium]|nr:M12 family metallo-peptidase [Chitinophagaceae bacterium]